ncbi:hypothetical protein ACJDU8_20805 [Clostridium sp. WILCCON 0269]|uniref:CARDB domain-containing protein n=1 Tax=Candidatus Clostridium eludens TaxID=3381663 RepID=A0ABW8SPJ1_9CLOT
MNIKRLMIIPLFIILMVLFTVGGFMFGKSTKGKTFNYTDIPNKFHLINIRIINTQRMPSSGTAYTLVLKNISQYLIKQNSVYLSYPIKHSEGGQTMNKCKVEATGNKIDIKPNEEVILDVFIPGENYEKNNKIDSNRPQFEIEGYLNEVSELTRFEQSGDFAK